MNKDKLRKVARLALEGVGGEKEAAKAILRKFKLTPEDILSQEKNEKVRISQTYKDSSEFEILKQLYSKITNTNTMTIWRINARRFEVELYPEQARKYQQYQKTILSLYRKEHKKFINAFIQANELFSDKGPDEKPRKKESEISREEILDMLKMAANIKNIVFGDLLNGD